MSDRLCASLRNDLLARRLQPGDPWPSERALMRLHGVSRTSVRESLARLRACGLVVGGQGRGATVGVIDRAWMSELFPLLLPSEHRLDYQQFFDLRLLLEPEAAARAARRRVPDKRARVREAQAAMVQATDGPTRAEADFVFHRLVADLSGMAYLPVLLDLLHPMYLMTIRMSCQYNRIRYQHTEASHDAISRALMDRDGEAARQGMRSHLIASAKQFIRGNIGA